ncbi:MAG TPA: type II toxin-antitoxin system RelE/ParE family toxin [Acidobacteriota bacterium]|nr:type II toxin-antitoxin system RelE/ParE family toxin [Acidobacteriota bacterium]
MESLDNKAQAKVATRIELLEEQGPNLVRPYADIVRGKIRELRIEYSSNEYRVLYFFFLKNEIILLHGFKKKTQELKKNDIEIAEERMKDWIDRRI